MMTMMTDEKVGGKGLEGETKEEKGGRMGRRMKG